jgi:hypothetical protein
MNAEFAADVLIKFIRFLKIVTKNSGIILIPSCLPFIILIPYLNNTLNSWFIDREGDNYYRYNPSNQ